MKMKKKSRNTRHGTKAREKGGADVKWGRKKFHGPKPKAQGAVKDNAASYSNQGGKSFTSTPIVQSWESKTPYVPKPKANDEGERRHIKPHEKRRFETPKMALPRETAADEKYSNKTERFHDGGVKHASAVEGKEYDKGMKLQQYLAHAGLTSRRKAEEFIQQGRVMVNGKTVTDVTARVRAGRDHVKFDGSLVHEEKPVYIMMNKPEGCISAITDPENRKTVVDIVKPFIKGRVYPVGRLDFNTTGVLLLTNDGDFANKVMHPKFEMEKKYVAKIQGRISSFALKKLVTGVRIEDGKMVKALNAGVYKRNDQNDLVFIVIKEGMNHQVKRMLQAVGASVVRLRRENIGEITDKGLNTGQWRFLTPNEIKYLTRG